MNTNSLQRHDRVFAPHAPARPRSRGRRRGGGGVRGRARASRCRRRARGAAASWPGFGAARGLGSLGSRRVGTEASFRNRLASAGQAKRRLTDTNNVRPASGGLRPFRGPAAPCAPTPTIPAGWITIEPAGSSVSAPLVVVEPGVGERVVAVGGVAQVHDLALAQRE